MILDALDHLPGSPEDLTGKSPKDVYSDYLSTGNHRYFEMRMGFGIFEIVLHGSSDKDVVLRTVSLPSKGFPMTVLYEGPAFGWDEIAKRSEELFQDLLVRQILAA